MKFQSFRAESLVSAAAPKAAYQAESTNPDETQLEMIRSLELLLLTTTRGTDCTVFGEGHRLPVVPFSDSRASRCLSLMGLATLRCPPGHHGPALPACGWLIWCSRHHVDWYGHAR